MSDSKNLQSHSYPQELPNIAEAQHYHRSIRRKAYAMQP